MFSSYYMTQHWLKNVAQRRSNWLSQEAFALFDKDGDGKSSIAYVVMVVNLVIGAEDLHLEKSRSNSLGL